MTQDTLLHQARKPPRKEDALSICLILLPRALLLGAILRPVQLPLAQLISIACRTKGYRGVPLAQCGRSATIWASSRIGDPYFVILGASLLPLA